MPTIELPMNTRKTFIESSAYNRLLEFGFTYSGYKNSTEAKEDGFKGAIEKATRYAYEVLDDASCPAPECGGPPKYPDENGWHWCHRHHDGDMPQWLWDEDAERAEELEEEYRDAE